MESKETSSYSLCRRETDASRPRAKAHKIFFSVKLRTNSVELRVRFNIPPTDPDLRHERYPFTAAAVSPLMKYL